MSVSSENRYKYWDSEWERTSLEATQVRLERMLDHPSHLEAYYPLVRLARRNNLENLRSLEVGCGSGSYSLILKKLGIIREAILLDVSPVGLDLAKNLFASFGEDCHSIRGDAMSLPFGDQEFDLVLSGGLLEHFRFHEQQKLVREQCRVARNVLCQVPASAPAYWAMRTILTVRYLGWRWGWERPMNLSLLRNLFKNAGYAVNDVDHHNLFTAGLLLYSPQFFDRIPGVLRTPLEYLSRHEIAVLCQKLV